MGWIVNIQNVWNRLNNGPSLAQATDWSSVLLTEYLEYDTLYTTHMLSAKSYSIQP